MWLCERAIGAAVSASRGRAAVRRAAISYCNANGPRLYSGILDGQI